MKQQIINTAFVFAVLVTLGFIMSCGNCIPAEGELLTKQLQLEEFQKLKIDLPANVDVRFGEIPSIQVTAPKSVFGALKTPVDNGTLSIEARPCVSAGNNEIQIELIVNTLKSIVINGSAKVEVSDVLNVEKLKLKVNGSGGLMLNEANTNQLDISLNGSGRTVIKNGKTEELEIQINGSGDYRGMDFLASDTEVKINGSGNARVFVTNSLKAKVLGSGSLRYRGNPQIETNISGSGSVRKIDE